MTRGEWEPDPVECAGRHSIPERALVAAILFQVVVDIRQGDRAHSIAAFDWVDALSPWFVRWCDFLGVDPTYFRSFVRRQFGPSIEARRAEHAAERAKRRPVGRPRKPVET